jgi:Tfp pilus assembly protein FimV
MEREKIMRSILVVAALSSLLFLAVGCPPKPSTVDTTPPPAAPKSAGSDTVGPPMTGGDTTGSVPAATPYPDSAYPAPAKTGTATGSDVKTPAVKNTGKTYTVQAHDTLFAIARNQLGSGASNPDVAKYVRGLKAANPGIDYDKLKVGQTLNLPEK